MVRNIIFDLGNVLLDYQPKEYLKLKNIEIAKIEDVYHQVFQSEEWILLDKGTITQDEAQEKIIERNPENTILIECAFNHWYDMLTPIEDTVPLLKRLKQKGYNLYFLSNFHSLAFEHVNDKYDFFTLFDGGVVSYKENTIKPDMEIYQKLIQKYSLKPQESIFIDDMLYNVEAAKKLNFNGIHFTNANNLKDELKNYNINL